MSQSFRVSARRWKFRPSSSSQKRRPMSLVPPNDRRLQMLRSVMAAWKRVVCAVSQLVMKPRSCRP